MPSPRSFKMFYTYGFIFLLTLFLFFISLYYHGQHSEFQEDLKNGYGVTVLGTVTGIGGKNNNIVYATYQFKNYIFNRDISYYNIDSMFVGTKIKLVISGIHPSNDVRYIGVDTVASMYSGIPLIHRQFN